MKPSEIQTLKSNITHVSVFGNPVDEHDNLVVSLVPKLRIRMPDIEFQIADPTENVEPLSDPWVILDVGIGIDEVVVVKDLAQLEYVKGSSVHDFDVYMELRLKEKLGQLPEIKLIIVPFDAGEIIIEEIVNSIKS